MFKKMPLSFKGFRLLLPVLVCLSACSDVEQAVFPLAELTEHDLEWAAPFVETDTLYFTNGESEQYLVIDKTEKKEEYSGKESKIPYSTTKRYEIWTADMRISPVNRTVTLEVAKTSGELWCALHVDGEQFVIPVDNYEAGKITDNDYFKFFPTLTVNDVEYENVLQLITKYRDSSAIQSIYYTKEHSIIRYDYWNDEIWERVLK